MKKKRYARCFPHSGGGRARARKTAHSIADLPAMSAYRQNLSQGTIFEGFERCRGCRGCKGCWNAQMLVMQGMPGMLAKFARMQRMLAGMLATVRGDLHGIYSVF